MFVSFSHPLSPEKCPLFKHQIEILVRAHCFECRVKVNKLDFYSRRLADRSSRVVPLPQGMLQTLRHPFQNDLADGHKGPVLLRRDDDAVLLGEEQSQAEGGYLCIGRGANDAGEETSERFDQNNTVASRM